VVDDTVRHDDQLLNTAQATWLSAPVGTPEARDGDSSDTNTLRIVLPAAIEKTVVATSLSETGEAFYNPDNPDVAIGELVTYEIRVTLGEGTQTVMVQDTLPAGLVFVSG